MNKTYHYTYKTTHINGKFYVGRHTSTKPNDNYFGSGKWVRSIKDKSVLSKEILGYYETHADLMEAEEMLIKTVIGTDGCMNFNDSPCGFASGDLNPAKSVEERTKRSLRSTGDLNPAKRPEVREKMHLAQTGRPRTTWVMSDVGRANISEARTGIKISDEGRTKLSESRLRDYADGTRKPAYGMLGKAQSDEAKKILSDKAKNRPKVECEKCHGLFSPQTHARWHGEKCRH